MLVQQEGAYEQRKSTIVALGQNSTTHWRRAVRFSGGHGPCVSELAGQTGGVGGGRAISFLRPVPCTMSRKLFVNSANRLNSSLTFQCLPCSSFSGFSRHYWGQTSEAVSEATGRRHLKLEALWPPLSYPLLGTVHLWPKPGLQVQNQFKTRHGILF